MIVATSCLGPLTATNVTISEGESAKLSCSLPSASSLPIIGGSWKRKSPSDVVFPTLKWEHSVVKWNSTNVNTDKVSIIDQNLNPDFNVMLKKVKTIL